MMCFCLLIFLSGFWGVWNSCIQITPYRRNMFRKEMFLQGKQLITDPMWTTVSPSQIACVSLCEHDVMCGSVLYVDGSDQCQGYSVWEWDLPTQRSVTLEGAMVFAKIISGVLSNLATSDKPTHQSTTFLQDTSDLAIDGVYAQEGYINAHCSHTAYGDSAPYWWVDLEHLAIVERVHIWNRDFCEDRLADITVEVGVSLDDLEECSYYGGPAGISEEVVLPCRRRLAGRFVKISGGRYSLPCDDKKNYKFLTLCQVQVFAFYL